jgi:hypothetical protein
MRAAEATKHRLEQIALTERLIVEFESTQAGPPAPIEHEHAFFAHQDPRWIVCDCGQLAERTRTPHGQYAVRPICDPRRVLDAQLRAETARLRSG